MLGRERVCAVINLDHIHNNVQQINKKVTKGTKILAVIKTDGYGHGAVMLAKELEALDCIFGYAVATIEE
ncbi:MAG TPA: alanine racemase, partial [Lachnospiraceae bacterium]|nr:alanine racemase [Lachnospiraceae bacterium]